MEINLNSFLALSYKFPNISSFNFTNSIKHGLKSIGIPVKKIGFSGTLDPFAHGSLIIGVNSYTKLLSHIKKDYKTYRATIFLGLESDSLDIENIINIHETKVFTESKIKDAIKHINGNITYKPPKFSAKHVNGIRSYKLAKIQKDFELKEITTNVKYLNIINYSHPFLTFETCISEGGYVRSIGEMICNNLNIKGSLCFLERTKEGELCYKYMLNESKSILDSKILCNGSKNMILDKDFKNISINVPFMYNGIMQNTKLILLDIKNIIKYDTIKLMKYAIKAHNGAKIILDSNICNNIFQNNINNKHDKECIAKENIIDKYITCDNRYLHKNKCLNVNNRLDNKIFLADFGTHFGIIKIFQNGKVEYILNRIDKC